MQVATGVKKFKRVVQLELNEISPYAIKTLLDRGLLPNFKKVWDNWQKIETHSEDAYENIEPWIQWVTAHTGQSFSDHQIFRLGDAHELKHPQIWEVLSDKGIESAVIGAMNASRGTATSGGVFFPDPWAKSNSAYPPSLQGLWSLISNKVQAHAVAQPSIKEIIQAMIAVAGFRLSPKVCARVAAQIVRQRAEPRSKWRLAGLFDLVLAEIFLHVLHNHRYKFCSLFLNSVAHYQHHFWRNFQPEKFNSEIKAPDCLPEDDPIRFGYELMDEILGKILEKTDLTDTLVLIASGLSQVPDTRHESVGGMNYYRLKDHKLFAGSFGIPPNRVYPLMSRDWQIKVTTPSETETLLKQLTSFKVSEDPLFTISQTIEGYLFVETAITRAVTAHEPILLGDKKIGLFHDHFVNIAIKSGHHTGVGVLWASSPILQGHQSLKMPLQKVFDVGLEALA